MKNWNWLLGLFAVAGLVLCINGYVRSTAPLPLDQQAELVDQPTLAASGPDQEYDDPHSDPRWHHTRHMEAKAHPFCCVCGAGPKGNAVHHSISAEHCVKAGYYILAVQNGPGQSFWVLCPKCHAYIGHGIGAGGSWHKFNLDISADVKAKRFNSRGRSVWKFKSEEEVTRWIKLRVEEAEQKNYR